MSTFLSSLTSIDKVVVAFVGVYLVYLLSMRRGEIPRPPGPRPLPFVGNMFQIPQKDEWPVYEAWAKKYGDITYLTMLGTPMVVLNSLKVVRDLMDERSRIYSHRPLMAIKRLCSLEWVLTYISGEGHRLRRTTVRSYFSGTASVKHRQHQEQEAHVLVANLLDKPDDLEDHTKQFTSSSILLGTYGYRVSSANDPFVHEMERSFQQAEKLSGPMAFLIELGPDLQKWPILLSLSGLGKTLDMIRNVFGACRVDPFMRAKQEIDNGTAVPCFISTSLDEIASDTSLSFDEAKQKEEVIMDCASVMYAAATDSSSSSLHCFFALMSLHPTVMQRAQEEIDYATEGERLPTFADWGRLPYINAIILEVLRYNTVTPLGLPHSLVEDDIYNGMLIPKGSMICVNLWLIFRDPEIFTDPDVFRPERFLGDEGARCREVLNLVWGSGRRSCPGRQFAEAVLFIAISSVIACFNMTPKLSPTGEVPELKFHDGFIRRPQKFSISITPRSKKWENIIVRERLSRV